MKNIANTDEDIRERFLMLVNDLFRVAEALGVAEEGIGQDKGIAPETMLEKIEELKRWASYY